MRPKSTETARNPNPLTGYVPFIRLQQPYVHVFGQHRLSYVICTSRFRHTTKSNGDVYYSGSLRMSTHSIEIFHFHWFCWDQKSYYSSNRYSPNRHRRFWTGFHQMCKQCHLPVMAVSVQMRFARSTLKWLLMVGERAQIEKVHSSRDRNSNDAECQPPDYIDAVQAHAIYHSISRLRLRCVSGCSVNAEQDCRPRLKRGTHARVT